MSSKGKRVIKKEQSETGLHQIFVFLAEMTTLFYCLTMLCIYPLYYKQGGESITRNEYAYSERGYGCMGAAKYDFFKNVGKVYLIVMAVLAVLIIVENIGSYLAKRSNPLQETMLVKDSAIKVLKDFSVTDWLMIAYLIVNVISYFLSDAISPEIKYLWGRNMAWAGFKGWNMGLVTQIILVGMYFAISRFWRWSPWVLLSAMVAAGIVYFVAIDMRFGQDPFKLYADFIYLHNNGLWGDVSYNNVIEKFVSTLGQTTWYSGYAMLIIPIGMYWYWNDTVTWSRILSAVFVCLGAGSIVTVNSDSAYIALVFILLVFFWYSMESNGKFLRFIELLMLVSGSFAFVGVLKKTTGKYIEMVNDDAGISEFMSGKVMVAVFLILVAIYLFCRFWLFRHKFNNVKNGKKELFDVKNISVIRSITVYLAIFLVWLVILLIILTTRGKIHFLDDKNFFNFTDLWGNSRGFNWKMAMRAVKNASTKDLLVGVGPDCFALAMEKYCQPTVREYWNGNTLACAHNEFLNMFVTCGFFGIVTYLGAMISQVMRLAKRAYKEPVAVGFMAVILAYIGHNIFCYQTCICTATLFVLMGMGEAVIRTLNRENA